MGQFKPMVKMETTEPSVELKLAKGGAVKMKKGGSTTKAKKMAMGGGAMDMMSGTPAFLGRPAVNAPVRAPGKPSMAMRRKAMMAKPAMPMGNPSMPAPMKKGGKAEGGDTAQDKAMIKKAFKQHDMQEHKGGKGTNLKLKKGGKMATGGVTDGQGGYKTGGVVLGNGGGYKDGGMPMKDGKPAFIGDGKGMKKGGMATGGVVNGQGGYATGGVTKSNGGGYKAGGKAMMGGGMAGEGMMGGGMMDDGMMNEGMSGAYKKGGATKKAYAAGGTVNSGRPVAMPQGSKRPSPPVRIDQLSGTFKTGGTVKMNHGGDSSDKGEDMTKGAYDKAPKYSRDLEDALNPVGMIKELAGKAKDFFMPKKTADSVTKTKESVTVTPAKKRGGSVKC